MNSERLLKTFLELVDIHSPSKNEKELSNYIIDILKTLNGKIYLDEGYKKYGGNSPTIFFKLKGDIKGEGVTLAAHMDVIEPNKHVKPIVEGNIVKTDKTTTLGGDDKAGIASIIETLRFIKEKNISHEDIYVIFTPCEEIGMLGAKNIDWSNIPDEVYPSKNMIVLDNAGRSGIIAHSAPAKYDFEIEFIGRKAHAGIEPEKGLNSITLSAKALSQLKVGRINEYTTSNISMIKSEFPSNVVPDKTVVSGEVRGHNDEDILKILKDYKSKCNKIIPDNGSINFKIKKDYPVLKPKDNLNFAKKFEKVYRELGLETELAVIGGGSDSNIFAEEGFNSIIVGVGMYDVHTVNEHLSIQDMENTTKALIEYISEGD